MSPCCWRWSSGRKTSAITVRDGSSLKNTLPLLLNSWQYRLKIAAVQKDEYWRGEEGGKSRIYIWGDKSRCRLIFRAAIILERKEGLKWQKARSLKSTEEHFSKSRNKEESKWKWKKWEEMMREDKTSTVAFLVGKVRRKECDPPSISHQSHQSSSGFICCGQDYINSSTSLCCVSHDGKPTTHPAGNATVTLKCCGSKVIHQEEECCNGIGFNPERHVCADRPTPGLPTQVCVYIIFMLYDLFFTILQQVCGFKY